MAKGKEVGVFQKEDGYWGYRFSIIIDGKQIAKRKFTDEKGNKLRTKSEAVKAREAAMVTVYILHYFLCNFNSQITQISV